MQKISAFKTEDGKIFENELDAKNHEVDIVVKEGLRRFCEEYFYSGVGEETILNIMFEYRDELMKILNAHQTEDD